MSLGSAVQIHKAAEVKGHFSTQRAHPEPPVQIPAWISSGCWLQQQEGTLQNGRKTHDRLCLYESSASLWTKIYSCLLWRGICFVSGRFEPAICVIELQLPLEKPNVLHSLSSQPFFPPTAGYCAHFTIVYTVKWSWHDWFMGNTSLLCSQLEPVRANVDEEMKIRTWLRVKSQESMELLCLRGLSHECIFS